MKPEIIHAIDGCKKSKSYFIVLICSSFFCVSVFATGGQEWDAIPILNKGILVLNGSIQELTCFKSEINCKLSRFPSETEKRKREIKKSRTRFLTSFIGERGMQKDPLDIALSIAFYNEKYWGQQKGVDRLFFIPLESDQDIKSVMLIDTHNYMFKMGTNLFFLTLINGQWYSTLELPKNNSTIFI
ncbi:hypothetical protein [Endozoicomonas sp. Mp262]|uniref:hypothetical protein n=1 Tax=Endozoicomonas sp. Mp262 TaxID=2919499 RepID=UPI0021DB0728